VLLHCCYDYFFTTNAFQYAVKRSENRYFIGFAVNVDYLQIAITYFSSTWNWTIAKGLCHVLFKCNAETNDGIVPAVVTPWHEVNVLEYLARNEWVDKLL
jgi:hypothetical protein